ncbi:hypothetical protein ACRALDRAFT_1071764 [Sodiomyces alcalophilus JCM 7366]|uniref:uncharacterized protein n=1 Tax=Sodiomyces alcalophilus JCM 7366 TaxID=591952 RepID=UPI0039B52CD3
MDPSKGIPGNDKTAGHRLIAVTRSDYYAAIGKDDSDNSAAPTTNSNGDKKVRRELAGLYRKVKKQTQLLRNVLATIRA